MIKVWFKGHVNAAVRQNELIGTSGARRRRGRSEKIIIEIIKERFGCS